MPRASTRDVRREVECWERQNEDTLRRFAVFLRKIVVFARGRSDGKLEVRRREVDLLELREQGGEAGSALSAAVEARWIEGESDGLGTPNNGSRGSDIRYMSEFDDENAALDWDEGSKDFTACSAEDCGYRGYCTH